MRVTKYLIIGVTASLLMGPTWVFAANDAALAVGSSAGDVMVSIQKGETVALTGLSDLNFGAWTNGDGDVSQDINFCAHSSTGLYQITAGGGNTVATSGTFELEGTSGSEIVYQVYWADAVVSPATDQLLDNNPLATQTGAIATDCGGVSNATLEIRIAAAGNGGLNLNNAAVGNYSDTLTLTIVPE
jgi:spore coat protein U-like protein